MKIKDTKIVEFIETESLHIASAVTGYQIQSFDDYSINQFNTCAAVLPKKGKRFYLGIAQTLVLLIREYNLIVDSRCYNLLRHIEDTFGPKDSSKAY